MLIGLYIKNIYDDYPEVQVVFTGSSLLQILDARADLSRRPVMLLAIIAESSPFMLNASKLSGAVELNRTTLLSYLKSLTDAKLIDSLFKDLKRVSSLQKPDKIFLENTNLMYLYQGKNADEGNVRETFLVNQLSYNQTVEFSEVSDFFVNDKYTIECCGKSKTGEQVKTLKNAFVASDGIETGSGSKIPLWLFGFLY